jgi:signal transduction histidine kinase
MILSTIALVVIIILCIFILYKVLDKSSLSNVKSRQTFSVLLVWIILWSVSILITDLFSHNLGIALWSSRLSFFTTALVGYWYYLFVKTYLNGKYSIVGRIGWGIITILFAIVSLTDKVVESVSYVDNNLQSVRGDLHIYFTIFLGVILLYSTLLFLKAFNKEENLVTKSQIFYIFWGSIFSIICSFSTNLIFPILQFKEIRALGPLSLIFLILATYYAILRYRFPSTKLIISKFVYFLTISILPYAIFHLVTYIQDIVWGSVYAPQALLSGFVYSAIFVLLFVFVGKKLEVILKEVFTDYKVNIQEEKEKLIIRFNDTLDVKNILQDTKDLLEKVFGSETKILIMEEGIILQELKEFGISVIDQTDLKLLQKIKEPFIKEELLHVEGKESERILLEKYSIRVIFPIKTSKLINWDIFIIIENGKNNRNFFIQDLDHIRSIGSSMAIALQRAYLYLEVENFNKSLKQKVDLQTEELQIKVKQLQEARKKESDMIDIMGHELRTPATVVKLNVSLLEKYIKDNPEEFKKYIKRIKQAVETEISLINTLLTSAKLEGNKIEVKKEKVDVKEEIEMSIHGHECELNKNTRLISNIQRNLGYVYADRVRVAEVLNNLIGNAIKFTEKGNIVIIAKSDNSKVTVSVKDCGKGISKKNIPKLGEKFFRVDNYLESDIVRPGGTGLGLYITFKLVRLMGGIITVESKVGEGSTFIFTLPKYTGQQIDNSQDSVDRFKRLGLKK